MEVIQTKRCSKCQTVKPVTAFSPNQTVFQSQCKGCRAAGQRDYRQKPEIKAAIYARDHTPERKAAKRAYDQTTERKAARRAYEQTPEYKAARRAYEQTPERKAAQRVYVHARYHKLPTGHPSKIAIRLRVRLRDAIRGNFKTGSAVRDLGCSIEDLKFNLRHDLERYGFTWADHGTKFHLDHIIPLASFDLSKRDEFCYAFHYTNLQVLPIAENLNKGDKNVFN